MSWATQIFTTISDLLKLESEITRLTSTGTASYIANGVDIAAASPEVESITATRGDEIVAIAATQLTIADGEELTIYLADSDDDVTFANIATGNINYRVNPSGGDLTVAAETELFRWVVTSQNEDYINAVITSSASNVGTISIYSTTKWAEKIAAAKDYLGVDVELMLINNGYRQYIDYSAGDEPKDLITNLGIFDMASHMKTLELIFTDLARGDEESIFWHKMTYYREMYKLHLDKAWQLKNTDYDLDGDTDVYRDSTENTRSFTR